MRLLILTLALIASSCAIRRAVVGPVPPQYVRDAKVAYEKCKQDHGVSKDVVYRCWDELQAWNRAQKQWQGKRND
jgi:hypothetical protein